MLDVYMEIWNSRKQELPIQEARIKMIDKPILLVLITHWSFCFCSDRLWTFLRRLALRWLVGRSEVTPGHVSLLPTTAKARQSNYTITPQRVRCNAMGRYLKPTNSTFLDLPGAMMITLTWLTFKSAVRHQLPPAIGHNLLHSSGRKAMSVSVGAGESPTDKTKSNLKVFKSHSIEKMSL